MAARGGGKRQSTADAPVEVHHSTGRNGRRQRSESDSATVDGRFLARTRSKTLLNVSKGPNKGFLEDPCPLGRETSPKTCEKLPGMDACPWEKTFLPSIKHDEADETALNTTIRKDASHSLWWSGRGSCRDVRVHYLLEEGRGATLGTWERKVECDRR